MYKYRTSATPKSFFWIRPCPYHRQQPPHTTLRPPPSPAENTPPTATSSSFPSNENNNSAPPLTVSMYNARQTLLQLRRSLHTISRERPSENLKKKLADLQKKKKIYDPKKTELFVETRESLAYLDTASMPMLLTFIGIAILAKLGMMYYDAHSQEFLERSIKKLPPGTGTVRMLSREEWEEIREIRPRTPFESKLARPNARIRTDDGLRTEDLKDWAIDVLMDAVTRVEETATHNPK